MLAKFSEGEAKQKFLYPIEKICVVFNKVAVISDVTCLYRSSQ